MITYEQIKNNKDIKTYITEADKTLISMGYTDHSFPHVVKVAETAAFILTELGYDDRKIELAKIAGYLHDIGNIVNRDGHSQSGAVMAFRILDNLGMDAAEISSVVSAIGNHDEGNGVAVNPESAALILADKSDVRRNRVRNTDISSFDIHDRVNYSVTDSKLEFSDDKSSIVLKLEIDTTISPVIEYFEIFLTRMTMCRKAANYLGLKFKLEINGQSIL